MAHKWPWLIVLAVAAGGGIAGGYLLRGRSAPPLAVTDQAVLDRLGRLEAGIPEMKRGLAQAGAQMGVMALNTAAAAGAKPDPESEAGRAAEQLGAAEREAKERAHYDQLDQLVRGGGGVEATATLRKNIAEAKARGKKGGGGELDIASLDCSDKLCRVEVRGGGDVAATSMAGLRILTPGMGQLTMRPFERGRPSVFYLAAPGQRLPPFGF
jgi:hypothetical protein